MNVSLPAAGTTQALYPKFSVAEFARRHAAAQALLDREGLAAIAVYGNSSMSRHAQADQMWLSGFFGNRNNYVAMASGALPVLFAQTHNHVPNAREMASIETRWGGADTARTLAQFLLDSGTGPGVLGYVGEVPAADWLTWQSLLPGWTMRDVTGAFRTLRLVKSDEEIEWLRRGAHLTDVALEALIHGAHAGLHEWQLGALVDSAAAAAGGLPHLCYLSSGGQDEAAACVPRQNLTQRILQRGDVINNEISVSWWGYSGQIQRPIFVGEAPGTRYRDLCEVALESYQRGIEVLRAGATSEEVLDAAEVIHQRGYTINDAYLHGFAVGLLPPNLNTRRTAKGRSLAPFVFQTNMCVVLQPNVVTEDERCGVQLGNLLRITDTGTECLHAVPLQHFVTR
jgi:Xaa-Pro dipeptidase